MATIKDKKYSEVQSKIKKLLAQAVKIKAIAVEDLAALLYILGQPTNAYELEAFVDIFSDSFPVLKDYQVGVQAELKGDLEEKVKNAVSKIVATDPMRAAEITKAALKPGATWEALKKEFPELE